jgi:hypothetical protein
MVDRAGPAGGFRSRNRSIHYRYCEDYDDGSLDYPQQVLARRLRDSGKSPAFASEQDLHNG